MQKIRVLLAESSGYRRTRKGLRLLLEAAGNIEIVAEAKIGRTLIRKAKMVCPDVVFMDLGRAESGGIQAVQQLLQDNPKLRVLLFSGRADTGTPGQIILMTLACSSLEETPGPLVSLAIRKACQAGTSPGAHWLDGKIEKVIEKVPPSHLTPRESELLQSIAEGAVNKQIALQLGISIKTVEKHRQTLMEKLNIHEVAGLTRYAIASGVVDRHSTVAASSPKRLAPAVEGSILK
jgi:DNA-binding NarL/FixJ family response regulator